MVQDPHAPLKLNFASILEMVNKDAGSPSRTSAESLSIIVSPWDFEGKLRVSVKDVQSAFVVGQR